MSADMCPLNIPNQYGDTIISTEYEGRDAAKKDLNLTRTNFSFLFSFHLWTR